MSEMIPETTDTIQITIWIHEFEKQLGAMQAIIEICTFCVFLDFLLFSFLHPRSISNISIDVTMFDGQCQDYVYVEREYQSTM